MAPVSSLSHSILPPSYIPNHNSQLVCRVETLTENTVEAESRIRDTDIAFEAASLTRQQVFRQVGIAMLAQVGTSSKAALELLL